MSRMNWKQARYSARERQSMRAGSSSVMETTHKETPLPDVEVTQWYPMKCKYPQPCQKCDATVCGGEDAYGRKNMGAWELIHAFHGKP